MAGRGVATVAIVGIVVVVLVGAGVFGYMYLLPSQHPSTTQSESSSVSTSQSVSAAVQGSIEITSASLSNNTIQVTIQNVGSQAVSINSLLVARGTGCSSNSTTSSSQTNQTRPGFPIPACYAGAAVFLVQSNDTLAPAPTGRFNFSGGLFNSSRSFTLSGNFSRTISGNFSRTISGNFSRGFGNFFGGVGVQLAAGQSVTLDYSGPIGSGVAAGSQYTIVVTGQQAETQITLPAL